MNHGQFQWGAGFQLGAFYVTDYCWQFGASVRSPQWFSDFEYNSQDQLGAPRTVDYGLDAPLTVALGTAYTGIDRTLFAIDAKFLNYSDTRGYDVTGFAGNGAIRGLGWDDVCCLHRGAVQGDRRRRIKIGIFVQHKSHQRWECVLQRRITTGHRTRCICRYDTRSDREHQTLRDVLAFL